MAAEPQTVEVKPDSYSYVFVPYREAVARVSLEDRLTRAIGSDLRMQILSDAVNVPISLTRVGDAPALGSARAYQQQQAAGLMTLEELGAMLKDLEGTRKVAEAELDNVTARRDRVEALENDRDDLLECMAGLVPEGLDGLTGEERNGLYRMLRLEVTPSSDGYEVRGAFSSSGLPPR